MVVVCICLFVVFSLYWLSPKSRTFLANKKVPDRQKWKMKLCLCPTFVEQKEQQCHRPHTVVLHQPYFAGWGPMLDIALSSQSLKEICLEMDHKRDFIC